MVVSIGGLLRTLLDLLQLAAQHNEKKAVRHYLLQRSRMVSYSVGSCQAML
jgi:hypothetical protein